MPHEPNDRDDASPPTPPRDLTTAFWYLRYTLSPTLYTDENSDVNDLLWQQVLELRGIRAWLAVIATVLLGALVVAVVALVAS